MKHTGRRDGVLHSRKGRISSIIPVDSRRSRTSGAGLMEWVRTWTSPGYYMMMKVSKSQELLQLPDSPRPTEITGGTHLSRQGRNPRQRDVLSKRGDLLSARVTFFWLKALGSFKHSPKVFKMFKSLEECEYHQDMRKWMGTLAGCNSLDIETSGWCFSNWTAFAETPISYIIGWTWIWWYSWISLTIKLIKLIQVSIWAKWMNNIWIQTLCLWFTLSHHLLYLHHDVAQVKSIIINGVHNLYLYCWCAFQVNFQCKKRHAFLAFELSCTKWYPSYISIFVFHDWIPSDLLWKQWLIDKESRGYWDIEYSKMWPWDWKLTSIKAQKVVNKNYLCWLHFIYRLSTQGLFMTALQHSWWQVLHTCNQQLSKNCFPLVLRRCNAKKISSSRSSVSDYGRVQYGFLCTENSSMHKH